MTLLEQARAVAVLRLAYADVHRARLLADGHFQMKYASLLARHTEIARSLDEAEAALRAAAVAAYQATPNRQPCLGVSIRLVQQVDYNPTVALAWARTRGLALKLDTKGFETLAKVSAGQPDGPPATITIVPHAAISETLGDLLGVTRDEPVPQGDPRD